MVVSLEVNVNLEHVFLPFVTLVSADTYLVGKCHLAQFYLGYHSTFMIYSHREINVESSFQM